jgi:hypothetical protein
VLPGIVPQDLIVARNERVAVCVTRMAAYPTGFEFELRTYAAVVDPDLDPWLFERLHRPGGAAPPEMLRIGVQFADGRKATSLGEVYGETEPPDIVMHSGGGGGGGGEWHQTMWVWPLPPPGPLAFVCEWPAAGLELTRREIEGQMLIDAAARARALFASH